MVVDKQSVSLRFRMIVQNYDTWQHFTCLILKIRFLASLVPFLHFKIIIQKTQNASDLNLKIRKLLKTYNQSECVLIETFSIS